MDKSMPNPVSLFVEVMKLIMSWVSRFSGTSMGGVLATIVVVAAAAFTVKCFRWSKKDEETFAGLTLSTDFQGMWATLRTYKAIHDGIGGGALITGILFL